MKVIEIQLTKLREAPWNPNVMDRDMTKHLTEAIKQFGLVENLVVRPIEDGTYQVLSGNQRFKVIRDLGFEKAPCVVVELDDARAMLLGQALNQIQGEDDPGLRAELMRNVLSELTEEEVLIVLPETAESLGELSSFGQEDMAASLVAWDKLQSARLQHLTFQLTKIQKEIVERALARVTRSRCASTGNPNLRGNALYELCKRFLGETDDE
ncbi:MAG: ParB N-terminal domain-containing protein [Planctomycetes bacterium]|nr:ParB N-terminal domain-containing protein [Planctomycetota bacterium]